MFEKRLQAFSYAAGMTFLIVALLNIVNFIVYSLMACNVLNFWPFTLVPLQDMMEYMLEIKLLGVIIGAVFLASYIWRKRLEKLG